MKKAFKTFICISLAGILLIHANYLVFYYVLYSINTASLTENFCEKKKSCCNAHCYLDKIISEQDEEKNSKQQTLEIKIKIIEYELKEDMKIMVPSEVGKFINPENFLPVRNYSSKIYHPPKA
ncbi:MAG: hypothetical protein IPI04_01670 [Ignavibacteria bacterium]|nr:hypothetical protein [Ignavibacteria bacterium]MBK9403256.1 hypothetical protein [Ignavibacteria bacterium]